MKEKGGLLKVKLSEIELGPEDSDLVNLNLSLCILLTVSDTGHGID